MALKEEKFDLSGLIVKCDGLDIGGTELTGAELTGLNGLTATATELNYLDITTLGTGAASKAVVLDASGDYTYPATGTIVYPSGATLTASSGSTVNIAGTFQVGGVAVTSTAAELNLLDQTAQTETIAEGGVVSVTKRYTKLTQTTTGAITLAAPGADMLGQIKVIEQVGGTTDAVTLALTNVVGGSAATTASFNADGEMLVLLGTNDAWLVIKELGVTLS